METQNFQGANQGKLLRLEVGNKVYERIPIRTHVITDKDDINDVGSTYLKDKLNKGDLVFVSERIVAIMQGRAYNIDDIKTTWLAKTLASHVHRSPYGIGLGSQYTMQLAIQEAGAFRILIAAAISAVGKIFGVRGLFYHVVGNNINAIDGPCSYTLPPYNRFAKLGPSKPNQVARMLKGKLQHDVVIIDANDLGVNVLGKSSSTIDNTFCKKVFRDNPLGQSSQQTPLCIVRLVG